MNTLPKELIEKSLALTFKRIEDIWDFNYIKFSVDENWQMTDVQMDINYPKFYSYLLTREFMLAYGVATGIVYMREHILLSTEFWYAIMAHQDWNPEPLTNLLSKIWKPNDIM